MSAPKLCRMCETWFRDQWPEFSLHEMTGLCSYCLNDRILVAWVDSHRLFVSPYRANHVAAIRRLTRYLRHHAHILP